MRTRFVIALALVLCPVQLWGADSSVQVRQVVGPHKFTGSGTVIKVTRDGYDVLTCCHVVLHGVGKGQMPLGEAQIKPAGSKWVKGVVVAYWPARDLALVRVADKKRSVKAVALAKTEDYGAGKKVVKDGYPDGKRSVVTGRGVGTSRGAWSYGVDCWMTTLSFPPSRSGDSGGGLFREDGKLVGVVWGKVCVNGTWLLAAVPVTDVHKFLDHVYAPKKPKAAPPVKKEKAKTK